MFLARQTLSVIAVFCLMMVAWNTGRLSSLHHPQQGPSPTVGGVHVTDTVTNNEEDLNVRKLLGSVAHTMPPHNPATPWVETLSWKPRIVLYHNFITPSEGQEIIGLGGGEVSRSLVTVRKDGSLDNTVSDARTSSGVFLNAKHMLASPLLRDMERRLADYVHVPAENGEGFYLLQYLPGQQYKHHTDWFDENDDDAESGMDVEGNRIITAIVYLQHPEAGGATDFPRVNITVPCRAGDAVIFWNFDPANVPDMLTEHAGLPVIKGVKWALTKWIRQRKTPYYWQNDLTDEEKQEIVEGDKEYRALKYGKVPLTSRQA